MLLFLVFAIAFGSVFWFWDGLGFEFLFPAPFGMYTWSIRIMVCTCRIALDVAVCVVVGACIDASIDTATRTTIGTISPPSISFGMKAYLFVRVLGDSDCALAFSILLLPPFYCVAVIPVPAPVPLLDHYHSLQWNWNWNWNSREEITVAFTGIMTFTETIHTTPPIVIIVRKHCL